jgi:hypothetical protein
MANYFSIFSYRLKEGETLGAVLLQYGAAKNEDDARRQALKIIKQHGITTVTLDEWSRRTHRSPEALYRSIRNRLGSVPPQMHFISYPPGVIVASDGQKVTLEFQSAVSRDESFQINDTVVLRDSPTRQKGASEKNYKIVTFLASGVACHHSEIEASTLIAGMMGTAGLQFGLDYALAGLEKGLLISLVPMAVLDNGTTMNLDSLTH